MLSFKAAKCLATLTVPLALACQPLSALAEQPAEAKTESTAPAVVNRPASALSPSSTIGKGTNAFTKAHPRLVLALSGGAWKCVAQIGVLRSLEKHHIQVDGIIGTSMGSTVGSLYCSGMPVDEIEKLFLDNKIRKAMVKGIWLAVLTRPLAPVAELFKGRPYAGMTSGKGYRELLAKKLPATFDELKIPFAAVVTNLTDGQTTVLAKGDLPTSVMASNCIPMVFKPVAIDGKLYVDGGLKANLPASIAQTMGADVVVAVLVDTAVKTVPNTTFKSKRALEKRVVDVMLASSDKRQSGASDVLIYPDVDFLPVITKNRALIRRAIAAGEKAADSVIPKIAYALDSTKSSEQKAGVVDQKLGQSGGE